MSSRALLVALMVIGLALLLVIWRYGARPVEEQVERPEELDYPSLYRAEAEGTISWADNTAEEVKVSGKLRASYVVYPDDRVVMTHLTIWIADIDLEVNFLWWQVEREELRCTRLSNKSPIAGALNGSRITIDTGAELIGRTYGERGPRRECRGPFRTFEIETETQAVATHDPAANRFALDLELETTIENTIVTVEVDVEGRYLNRPPVAVLETAIAGTERDRFSDGCPDTRKGEPPIAVANTADGLLLHLRSGSYDPDGLDVEQIGLKRPRFDIRQERWLHSDGGRFRYLGDGPTMGPVLFETGREHRLLLIVVDRSGSQGRTFCHFQVVAPEEAS